MITKGIRSIIERPPIIVSVLILYKAYVALAALRADPPRTFTAKMILGECVVLIGMFLLASTKDKVATWILAGAIWAQALFTGLMIVKPPDNQDLWRVLGFMLTVYFIFGGLVIIKRVRVGTPNQAL